MATDPTCIQTPAPAAKLRSAARTGWLSSVDDGGTINAPTDVYNFLNGKVRTNDPAHVVFTTNRLRYNRAWWVQIDDFNEWNQWNMESSYK